jgi:hypothetical protein
MENKEPQLLFSLVKIVTEQFAIILDSFNENKEAIVQYELNFATNKEVKQVYVRLSIRFTYPNGSPFIVLTVGCQFLVENDSWELMKKPDSEEIIIPKNMATHLAMLTIGTCRGVLHSKLSDSQFAQMLLPTIDVTALVPADILL